MVMGHVSHPFALQMLRSCLKRYMLCYTVNPIFCQGKIPFFPCIQGFLCKTENFLSKKHGNVPDFVAFAQKTLHQIGPYVFKALIDHLPVDRVKYFVLRFAGKDQLTLL